MGTYVLENDYLKVTFRNKSAEMISIIKKETGVEYLWNGDAKYWGWSSPVLFPFVGSLRDKTYTYEGNQYHLNQHGFARQQEFDFISQTEDEIWFELNSNEVTRENYPFEFKLACGYKISGNTIKVLWRVTNTDNKVLYFSIGAHPAFMCPLDGKGEQTDYYMGFDTDKPELMYRLIDQSVACVDPKEYALPLEDGMHKVEATQFDLDALIIEHHQAHKMFLAGPDKVPYLTVDFDAPLFGVWSPTKKNAPFICIEPWYGRSDSTEFNGVLQEREYEMSAQVGDVVEKSYLITVH